MYNNAIRNIPVGMEKLEKLKMVNFGFNGIITADKASFDYIIRVFPTAFNNQRYMRDVKYYGDRPKNLFKDNAQIFVEKQEIKVKAYQVFDLVPAATTFEYWLYDIADQKWTTITSLTSVKYENGNFIIDESLLEIDKEYYFRTIVRNGPLNGSIYEYGPIKITKAPIIKPVDPKPVNPKPVEPTPLEPTPADSLLLTFVMEGSRESSSTGIIEKIVRTNEHDAYIKGYPDNTVKPDGNLTIAEAAAMIYRLLEINATTIESKFSDVADEWFATYVNQLANMNVVNGYEDGSFKPNNNVSRAEFTKMISSFSKLVSSKSVSLVDIENHWAETYIEKAAAQGVIKGYQDNTFKPDNFITRAEAAKILNIVFERGVQAEGLVSVSSTIRQFTDLSTNHWANYELVEATNDHEYYSNASVLRDENYIKIK